MTRAQQAIEWLQQKGFLGEELPHAGQYRKFQRQGREGFYFIGRNSAVRVGRCRSKSVSLTFLIEDKIKEGAQ